MTNQPTSGQHPYTFAYRDDLRTVPSAARSSEENLHGSFAVDKREGFGQLYYGMPGQGILRVDDDLSAQELIRLPSDLTPLNFHSTELGSFDGNWRLFLSAEGNEMVAVVTLEGELDFILPRPEFEVYRDEETPYKPTDTVLVDDTLYIADGYGSNYVSAVELGTKRWTGIFGGPTEDPAEDGKFATAHGVNVPPTSADRLIIADRPSSRLQQHGLDGTFLASHKLPQGAWPCGIDYINFEDRWLGVIGSLVDPQEGRPAPIYIVDGMTYEVLSTIRPKEELGIEPVQHLHNVVWHVFNNQLFLVCQAWNPGYYFVLAQV